MQTQQHKLIKQNPSHKQRLSVGEIVIVMLNLLFSGMAWLGVDALFQSPSSPYLFGCFLLGISILGAGLSSVLTILSQRRMAIYLSTGQKL